MTRRFFLSCALLFAAAPAVLHAQDVQVTLDPGEASGWTIDENIFGKFFEHNGRDAYPGLYAQHFANSSFEPWCTFQGANENPRCETNDDTQTWKQRTAVLYRGGITQRAGLSYPWEPFNGSDAVGDPATDGPRGEAAFSTISEGQTSDPIPHDERFQRFTLEAGETDGLQQRVALPDKRTRDYEVSVTLRGTVGDVTVYLEGPLGRVYDQATISVGSSWQRRTVPLANNDSVIPGRYRNSPSGEYVVSFVAEGPGRLDLDRATLFPSDAVQGQFNPSTIDLLKKHNVTSLRWPGGNWASAYQWRDGVGPVKDRPVRWNIAWGGLEHNYLGTEEFLAFAEEAEIEPYLNVGFNMNASNQPLRITPQEAAEWVRYTNDDSDIPDVKYWQIGNETYGGYQIGHTNPCDYADGVRRMANAMKSADPTITVIAAGIDPLYTNSGYTLSCGYWKGNDWNRILLNRAGGAIDGIDIHRYVNGVQDDSDLRNNWTQDEYLRTLISFPTQFQDIVQILRRTARDAGHPNILITVGEWNLGPANAGAAGWPTPTYPKMAHAAFMAGMFNTFMREGDAVRFSYQRDNILFYRPYPIDFQPVNPGNFTLQFYAEPFADSDTDWNYLPPDTTASATFDLRAAGSHQQDTPNVPYVDVASIVSDTRDRAVVYAVNRDLQNTRSVEVELADGWQATGGVEIVKQFSSGGPFDAERRSTDFAGWFSPDDFTVNASTAQLGANGRVRLDLPPVSVARLTYQISDGGPPTAEALLGGPYEVDDNTVALLHFDGTFANASPRAPDGQASQPRTSDSPGASPNGPQDSFFDDNVPVAGGSFGQSLHLDNVFTPAQNCPGLQGLCEYVSIADDDDLDLTGDWTIEAWVYGYPYGPSNIPHFFYKAQNVDQPAINNFYLNGALGGNRDESARAGYNYTTNGGGFQQAATPAGSIAPEQWYHYAFIRDPERGHLAVIVRDANRDVVATGTSPLGGAPTTTDGPLFIGVHPYNNTKRSEAEIDEVRISDVVRSRLYEGTSLPVELTSFTGTADGDGAALLTWRTASETDNARFEVQQQTDGSWTQIGRRQGAGTTSEPHRYRFRTGALDPGTHSFRLRQVDRGGTPSFSEPVTVELGMAERAVLKPVYPNPARERATVRFGVRESAPVTLTLYDALGRKVRTVYEGTPEAEAMQTVTLDGGGLPSGLYLLRLRAGTFAQTKRLVVAK